MLHAESTSDDDLTEFRRSLLDWYAAEGRRLPWRDHGGDAYRVVVSELMLVQTTVATVIPFYERFLSRFPTVQDLARADQSEVLKLWEGLGYYRRARQLHDLSRIVDQDYNGEFPRTADQIESLPGVGRYIAGAIRSFAFNQPAPILEANTIRVLARLIALTEPVDRTISQKQLWSEAALRVDPDQPGAFNQAMMDLGSLICTPTKPSCLFCPVRSGCQSFSQNLVSQIPLKSPRKPPKTGSENALILRRQSDDALLLLKRSEQGLWANFWELPCFWTSGADPARRAEAGFCWDATAPPSAIDALLGVCLAGEFSETLGSTKYVVTTHKMELKVYSGIVQGDSEPRCPVGWLESRFFEPHEITQLTISAPHRKVLKRFNGDEK